MFWCSMVGADRPPKQAMPVVRQEDLVQVPKNNRFRKTRSRLG